MHLHKHLDDLLKPHYTCFVKKCGIPENKIPPLEIMSTRHADYQINNMMRLSKILSRDGRSIAQEFITTIPSSETVEKYEVAGPGFINIYLKKSFLENEIFKQHGQQRLGFCPKLPHSRVVVDYSSPNIAKQMHVGHLRSTIIGESLARLFTFAGDDVLRLNHIGDYGTQFGMLITYCEREKPDLSKATLDDLLIYYKASKELFDNDPLFKEKARQAVIDLQSGQPHALEIWKKMCHISREGYNLIYDLLNVHLTERGESFYTHLLPQMVQLVEKEKIATLSDGALCIFMEGFENQDGSPLPMIIRKQDGGYNYATTDLAALWHRVHEEKADRIIYVVDNGQSLHFKMLFKAAERAHIADPSKVRLDHVGFGVVLGEDGKKFKTRSGHTEKLSDLMAEAIERAFLILKEKDPELDPHEMARRARIIGLNAIKYADLSSIRTKDYQFSYDRMLRFEGNTASFLLYAYVRMKSILRKAPGELLSFSLSDISIEHPSERALALHLLRFGDLIESIYEDLYPHRLADYLYELAETFNLFFRDCPVLTSSQAKSRLFLCDLSSKVVGTGLSILGLELLEKM